MGHEIVSKEGRFVGLRGIAAGVVTRTVAGAGKMTFQEVRFRVAGHEVAARMVGDVLAVADGDEVIVSGYVHEAEVIPVAWWNCTQSKGYSPSTWGLRPTVIAFVVVAALALWLVLVKHATLVQIMVLVVPVLILGGVAYTDYTRRRCAAWVSRTRQGRRHG